MAKWADYVITGKREDQTKITHVERRVDNGGSLGVATTVSRQTVVNDIKINKKTHVTAYRKDGKWQKGEDVRVVTVNGVDYLRTDANQTPKDNLDNLPDV